MRTATVPTLDDLLEPPPSKGPVADYFAARQRLAASQAVVASNVATAKATAKAAHFRIEDVARSGGDIARAVADALKADAELEQLSAELRALTDAFNHFNNTRMDAERRDPKWRAWADESGKIRSAYHKASRPRMGMHRGPTPVAPGFAGYQQYQRELEDFQQEHRSIVVGNLLGLQARLESIRRGRAAELEASPDPDPVPVPEPQDPPDDVPDAGMVRLGRRRRRS